jgi:DNA-binding MarR family transcriptional regulator
MARAASSPHMERYVPLARDLAARVALFHEAAASKLGLNATDVKALRLLSEQALTAGSLANQTGLTGAAVTALVDRLEQTGYVMRERDAGDRRRVTIRAAPAKIRELDRLYAGLSLEMAALLAKYDASEFALIADYITNATEVLAKQTMKLRAERVRRR